MSPLQNNTLYNNTLHLFYPLILNPVRSRLINTVVYSEHAKDQGFCDLPKVTQEVGLNQGRLILNRVGCFCCLQVSQNENGGRRWECKI